MCYCVNVKNITISIDDDVYRQARIKAAQQDTSVSALVKDYLVRLIAGHFDASRDLKREQEALLDSIRLRHPGFSSVENISRDALHERDAVR